MLVYRCWYFCAATDTIRCKNSLVEVHIFLCVFALKCICYDFALSGALHKCVVTEYVNVCAKLADAGVSNRGPLSF